MVSDGRTMLTRMLYGIVALLLLGIVALAAAIALTHVAVDSPSAVPAIDTRNQAGAVEIAPPRPMPDATLLDQYSAETRLSDFRGQLVLLTFGYTHCPDVCPLTLNEFQRTQQALGGLADAVKFVFVSVDGARDTPETIRSYFGFRGLDDMVGLTGSEDAARTLGEGFGVSFERAAADESGFYLVNHTAGAFLLDQQGRWIRRYPFGVMPSEMAADLKTLLN